MDQLHAIIDDFRQNGLIKVATDGHIILDKWINYMQSLMILDKLEIMYI